MGPPNITEPSEIGDWARISVLGSGSFGIVSLWRCKITNDSIAVKKCKLHCDSSLKPKHKERWCKEVQIMKELDHPNIVKYKLLNPVLEKELMKWNPSKLPLLPMEYCQKGNLRHILTQPHNMCGLKEDRVRDILLDISSAVHYLHSNKITHRDIKPENIVLQDCPTMPDKVIYKLIDLGYAKELGDSTISFVGTLAYLAPEIIANTKYTCTVDYWSFGVVAFEIICGILPFMSKLTPIERYHLAEDKKPEEICVFLNHLGNYQFSSELFKENRISACLKNFMETWLRKALHFDPKKRAEPFPDSSNFFDHLNYILKKKILNVFVVYKYKFYSYEFDECTRLSTVRQWIARDTGILQEEQILLGSFQFGDLNDQTLIADCFIDDYKLFLFKRDALFKVDEHYYPRLVKQMFNKPTASFGWQELKRIYSHCIHYIQNDIFLASAFSKAMDLYLKQLTMALNKILKSSELCKKKLMKLTEKVKEFNNKVKNENLSCIHDGVRLKLNRLFESIEKSIKVEHEESKHIRKLQAKLDAMRVVNLAVDVIKLPQLQELLDKAVVCFQKTAGTLEQNNKNLRYGEMFLIVSKVIKFKDALFLDTNLESFSRHLRKSADVLKSLSTWIVPYDAHLTTLDELFEAVMLEAVGEVEQGPSISNKQCEIRKPSVIDNDVDQTELLSSRFTEVLTDSISTYRNILEEIDSYIEDISSLL